MHRSAFLLLKWLGFFLAAVVATVSAVMGALEGMPTQDVMLYSIAIFAVILWGWHHLTVRWTWQPPSNTTSVVNSSIEQPHSKTSRVSDANSPEADTSYFGSLINSLPLC